MLIETKKIIFNPEKVYMHKEIKDREIRVYSFSEAISGIGRYMDGMKANNDKIDQRLKELFYEIDGNYIKKTDVDIKYLDESNDLNEAFFHRYLNLVIFNAYTDKIIGVIEYAELLNLEKKTINIKGLI